jgi:hypothetical protein
MGQIGEQLPILQYLMVLNNNQTLNFVQCSPVLIPAQCTNHTISELISAQISPIMHSKNMNVRYCGYLNHNNSLYLFGQINAQNNKISQNVGMFSLIDEIVNVKSSSQVPICLDTVSLFTNNPILCFLYDTKNRQIKIPVVGYTLCSKSKINYHIMYGIDSSSKYYCTNATALTNQLASMTLSDIRILRVAIFISTCKIMPQSQNEFMPIQIAPQSDCNTYTYYPKLLTSVICMKTVTDSAITQVPLSDFYFVKKNTINKSK